MNKRTHIHTHTPSRGAGKGYGAFIQNPGAWLLSDGKASLVEILCFRGKECNDEEDEDDALEPSRLDAPKKAMLVLKSQMQGTGGANVLDCDYLVRPRGCLGSTVRVMIRQVLNNVRLF